MCLSPRTGVRHASLSDQIDTCAGRLFICLLAASMLFAVAVIAYEAMISARHILSISAILPLAAVFWTLAVTCVATPLMMIVISIEKGFQADAGGAVWGALIGSVTAVLYMVLTGVPEESPGSLSDAGVFVAGIVIGLHIHATRARHLTGRS